MEELVGPEVEVILTLREAVDLGFINAPIFAQAVLCDNQMSTDIYNPDTVVRFNTELVWESNKTNVKKMRNNNIPIKLNLYKHLGENHREKFGYVILNLRSAQYVPKGKSVQVTEDYFKILGLGKEAKGSSPQILMSLRIRDKVPESSSFENANLGRESVTSDNFHESKEVEERNKDADLLQLCEKGNTKIEDEYTTLTLKNQSSPGRSPRMKHSLTSSLNGRKETSSNHEKKNSSGDLQPQKKYIQAYHNYKLEVRLENILWLKLPPKFRFKFHHSRSEILCTAHPEITIENVDEIVELCDIKAVFSFVETPSEFGKLISSIPPMVSISCNMQNRPVVIARGTLETEKLTYIGEETIHKIELIDFKSHEVIAKLTYAANLTDCGAQIMKDVTLKLKTSPSFEESDLPPAVFENVTEKIVDELEDWKERQKEQFQREFTAKLQKEMEHLRSEWTERRKELERKVNERMEECRQLGNSLINATEEVKQKKKEFLEKEKNLEVTKSELESHYLKLLTDKNEETSQIQREHDCKMKQNELRIAELEKERKDLEKQIKLLKEENEQLRTMIKQSEIEFEKTRKTCLSQEQTATLLQDLKTMQEKLETANNSKLFFKEQWGRAVREIHRIKSEYSKNIQVQLQYRKDELKKLGLEQLFISEKNKNNLERDDILEAKDFINSDFEVRNLISDADFPYKARTNYESFKTNMDIVKENNSYLLKFNQESEEKLKRLIEERDKLLSDGNCQIDDENIVRLNKEIRHLLEH